MKPLTAMIGEKESLRAYLIRGTSGTFVLKVASTLLGFIISLLLAQLLGAAGYGVYAYALAWVGLLSVPATLGFNQLLVREVAVYHARADWSCLRGILHFSNRAVLLSSLVLMVLAAFVVGWLLFDRAAENTMLYSLLLALPLVPIMALTQLRQSTMRGFHRVIRGQVPEMLIRPLLFIALVVSVCLLMRQYLSPPLVITLNLFATIVAFGVGARWLQKILPKDIKNAEIRNHTRSWMSSALPLLFIGGMQIIIAQTDIIMLGSIKGTEAAGIYAVANRLAFLIVFVLMSVNTVLAPIISRLYISQDIAQLQSIVTKAARTTLAVSLMIWMVLIFFGSWFLSLFGIEFIKGQAAMAILSTGLVVCTSVASVGLLLSMTRYEKDLAWVTGLAAMTNIILNGILIPKYSIEGAAIATSVSVILSNVLAFFRVYKKLGINSSIFGNV